MQADTASAMFLVYQGNLTAYNLSDEAGAPYTGSEAQGGVERDAVVRQLEKKRRSEAAARDARDANAKAAPVPKAWRGVLSGLAAQTPAAAKSAAAARATPPKRPPAARPAPTPSSSTARATAPAAAPAAAAPATPERFRRRHPGEGEKMRAASMVRPLP